MKAIEVDSFLIRLFLIHVPQALAISDEGKELFFQSIVCRAGKKEREKLAASSRSAEEKNQETPAAAEDPGEEMPHVAETGNDGDTDQDRREKVATPSDAPVLPPSQPSVSKEMIVPNQPVGQYVQEIQTLTACPGGASIVQPLLVQKREPEQRGDVPVPLLLHPAQQSFTTLTNDLKKTFGRATVKDLLRGTRPKETKPVQLKLNKSHSVFGQGAITVPGGGFIMPMQNYVSQLGQSSSQPQVVRLMPQIAPKPGPWRNIAPKGGLKFQHNFQPYSLPVASVPQQPFGVMYGNQITAAPLPQPQTFIQVPGQGLLIPVGQIKQEPIAVPPTLSLAQNSLTPQPQKFPTPTLPGTSQISAAPGAQSVDQLSKSQTMSSGTSKDTGASSSAEDVVRVTVVENDNSVSIHVEEKQDNVTSKESETPGTLKAKDVGPTNTLPQNLAEDGEQPPLDDMINENHPSTSDASNVQGSVEQKCENDKSEEESDSDDLVLPPLPPNEATISAFMQILLQRRRLETQARQLKTFKSYFSRRKESKYDKLTDEETPKRTSKTSGTDASEHASTSKVKSEAVSDTNLPGTSEEQGIDQKPRSSSTKKKSSFWTFSRTQTQFTEAVESIRDSEWYHVLKERFLSMFLWPALLSIVGPHKATLSPVKKGRRKRKTDESKASQSREGGNTRPATNSNGKPRRRRKKTSGIPRKIVPKKQAKKKTDKDTADGKGEIKPKRVKKSSLSKPSAVSHGIVRRTRNALRQEAEAYSVLMEYEERAGETVCCESIISQEDQGQDRNCDLPNQKHRLPTGEGHAQGQVTNGWQEISMDVSQVASTDTSDPTEQRTEKVSGMDRADRTSKDCVTPSIAKSDGEVDVSVLPQTETRGASYAASEQQDTFPVEQQKGKTNGVLTVHQGGGDSLEAEESHASEETESNRSSLPVKKRAKTDFELKVAFKKSKGSPRGRKRTHRGGDADGKSPKKVRWMMDSEKQTNA